MVIISINYAQNENLKMECLNNDSVYIVCRSTSNKKNIIAKDFNIKDTLITHVGLGLYLRGEMKIYNVSINKKNKMGSSLIKESISEFKNIKDITYISIWKKCISKIQLKNLKKDLKSYENKVIDFDSNFKLIEEDLSLYCSEFVYLLLKKSGILNIDYSPQKKKLNGMYKTILGENFEYVSVDFFQLNENFKKVFENKLNN